MKKITLIHMAIALLLSTTSIAQNIRTATFYDVYPGVKAAIKSKITDDTLFIFDGNSFFLNNTQDQTDFNWTNYDGDSLTPHPDMVAEGWTSDFNFWYSTDSVDFISNYDSDTSVFIGATSWFDPGGKANNWFSFGPITIPEGQTRMSWYHRIPDVFFSDGYRVFISTTSGTPTDIDTTTATPVYNRPDCPPGNCPLDTAWRQQWVDISNYAGDRIYVHFNHNANDQYVLYLKMIVIAQIEGASVILLKNKNLSLDNFPNPVLDETTVAYTVKEPSQVSLIMYDITGKEIMNLSQGYKSIGKYYINLNALEIGPGIYFYSLITQYGRETKKMVIGN